MYHSITRKAFAVVVSLLVACSFVAAPVAAVAGSGTGLDTLSTGDSTATDGETDAGTEDDEDAEDEDADSDSDESGDAEGEDTDTGDADDTEEDAEDDGESDSDDTEEDSDDERTSENVTDAVEDTVDGVTDGVEETVDGVEGTVDDVEETTGDTLEEVEELEATNDEVVGPLEELGTDGVDVVELVGSFDVELRGTDGEDETTSPARERPGVYGEHDPAPAESREVRPAVPEDGDADTDAGDTADADDDGSEDESPAPSDPGVVVGFGAVATAVALRGGAVVPGGRVAASGGWLSVLLKRLPAFLVPLRYSRYDDSDPLEHEARERVYEIVNETPGSYLSEVSEEADLPLSTTRHHIKVLEREDLVTGAKLHGKRRFYPAYTEGIELAAALNDESTATIIRAIARIGAASVSDLADELGRDPSTVSHHLQRLEEDGLVTREREGRAVVNRLSAEARTALEPEATPGVGEASEVVAGGAD